MMKKVVISLLCLKLIALNVFSQELKRRASLGIYVSEISDSIARLHKTKFGVYIDSMTDQKNTEKHHLKINDIILRINNENIGSPQDLTAQLKKYKEGDEANFELIRNGKTKNVAGIFPGFPFESSDNHDVIYDEFAFDGGYIRTITDKPRGDKKFPAILFIQGYTCSSIDNVTKHPYTQLAKGLCDKGYVVMRMEKPGMGDCNNQTPCADLDFNTETEAFSNGLHHLKSYDFVDTEKVFIWGHSMGGIIAPIIANNEKIKGIIVYGTTINPWREYLPETFRFQYPLFGIDYVELEDHMLEYYRVIHELFVEKKKPSDIAEDSVYLPILRNQYLYDGKDRIFGRNYKAFVQIDEHNIYRYWSQTEANVLVFWADADIQAFSKREHETIVNVVNHYHPGNAELAQLNNTNHAFVKVKSMQDGIANRNWNYMTTHFNDEVVENTDQWIRKILE